MDLTYKEKRLLAHHLAMLCLYIRAEYPQYVKHQGYEDELPDRTEIDERALAVYFDKEGYEAPTSSMKVLIDSLDEKRAKELDTYAKKMLEQIATNIFEMKLP